MALRQHVLGDQRLQHAFTDVRPQAEQTLCLSERQPQARHFVELGANPAKQLFAGRKISAVGKHPQRRSRVHTAVLSERRSSERRWLAATRLPRLGHDPYAQGRCQADQAISGLFQALAEALTFVTTLGLIPVPAENFR